MGRNLATMELLLIISSVFRRYHVVLQHPEKKVRVRRYRGYWLHGADVWMRAARNGGGVPQEAVGVQGRAPPQASVNATAGMCPWRGRLRYEFCGMFSSNAVDAGSGVCWEAQAVRLLLSSLGLPSCASYFGCILRCMTRHFRQFNIIKFCLSLAQSLKHDTRLNEAAQHRGVNVQRHFRLYEVLISRGVSLRASGTDVSISPPRLPCRAE